MFASGALGASSTAIGTGVRLSSVSQQFTQGTVSFSDNNLDLSINGQGFFRLNDGGAVVYSRAGALGLDRDGYIVNSSEQRLTGFLADSLGNIGGAQGDLQLSTANLAPSATTTSNVTLNLDLRKVAPTSAWVGNTTHGAAAPSAST